MRNITDAYQEQLRLEHSGSKWGATAWRYGGDDIVKLLNDHPAIRTVLDFGAGKATMKTHVVPQLDVGRDISWTNYDPGVPGIDKLPKGQFDLVITCDVLEHIEPEYAQHTLQLLASYTRQVLYNNIACYPTGKLFSSGPYRGQDLHLSIHPPAWWRDQVNAELRPTFAEFEYRHIERLRQGTLKPRCVLIHERVVA